MIERLIHFKSVFEVPRPAFRNKSNGVRNGFAVIDTLDP